MSLKQYSSTFQLSLFYFQGGLHFRNPRLIFIQPGVKWAVAASIILWLFERCISFFWSTINCRSLCSRCVTRQVPSCCSHYSWSYLLSEHEDSTASWKAPGRTVCSSLEIFLWQLFIKNVLSKPTNVKVYRNVKHFFLPSIDVQEEITYESSTVITSCISVK